MTTEPLRWGIASSMCEAFGSLPDAEVIAVGSRSQGSTDTLAARFGIPHADGTYEQLFADPDVDVVDVCSSR